VNFARFVFRTDALSATRIVYSKALEDPKDIDHKYVAQGFPLDCNIFTRFFLRAQPPSKMCYNFISPDSNQPTAFFGTQNRNVSPCESSSTQPSQEDRKALQWTGNAASVRTGGICG